MATQNQYIIDDDELSFLVIRSDAHGILSFVIDTEDIDRLKCHKWTIQRCTHNDCNTKDKFYAKATDSRNLLMHRYIVNAQKGQVVNHINGNTFDMRKKNLFCGSYADNNRGIIREKNVSGRVGVTYNKLTGRWHAYIGINGEHKSLGYFDKKEDAIEARRMAEEKYWGNVN